MEAPTNQRCCYLLRRQYLKQLFSVGSLVGRLGLVDGGVAALSRLEKKKGVHVYLRGKVCTPARRRSSGTVIDSPVNLVFKTTGTSNFPVAVAANEEPPWKKERA